MKKSLVRLLALALALILLPVSSLCERVWLISDSDHRELTEDELWQWDYESLGYILNELFARHGYVFNPGGEYEHYFMCMPWYTPNDDPDNTAACYPQLNSIEWANERIIKKVRADMRAQGTQNKDGRSVWSTFSSGFSTLQGFDYATLPEGQVLPVYAAPSANSWRGANGKAAVSTNGAVYAAGWESGWLLIMYETNNGSVRVGYVDNAQMTGAVSEHRMLNFNYTPAVVTSARPCQLTDDPARCYASITTLNRGDEVLYLSTFFNDLAWDYVETTVDGQTVRGFIRSGCLDIQQTNDDY